MDPSASSQSRQTPTSPTHQFRGSATISRHLGRARTSPSICFTFWRCLHPPPNPATTVNAALAEAASQTHIPRTRNGCCGLSSAAFDERRGGQVAKLTWILLSKALHSPIHPPAFPPPAHPTAGTSNPVLTFWVCAPGRRLFAECLMHCWQRASRKSP